jgi:predicted alpha/beta hydrolase family esterase
MNTLADYEVLMLPGVGGAGAEHWQTFWEQAFPEFRRVQQQRWDLPVYAEWAETLSAAIAAASKPVLLVAHSLGTSLIMRWAHDHPQLCHKVAGAFMVATTDIERFEGKGGTPAVGFAPMILAALPFPAMVLASRNDERVSFERAQAFAHAWGARFVDVGMLGHIGSAAQLGLWPRGLLCFGQFVGELSATQAG